MEELRANENGLQREITPIDQESWGEAHTCKLASLKGRDILGTLSTMLESSPSALRGILELVF